MFHTKASFAFASQLQIYRSTSASAEMFSQGFQWHKHGFFSLVTNIAFFFYIVSPAILEIIGNSQNTSRQNNIIISILWVDELNDTMRLKAVVKGSKVLIPTGIRELNGIVGNVGNWLPKWQQNIPVYSVCPFWWKCFHFLNVQITSVLRKVSTLSYLINICSLIVLFLPSYFPFWNRFFIALLSFLSFFLSLFS